MMAVIFCFSLSTQSFPQSNEVSFSSGMTVKPGVRFEYMDRNVDWGEEEYVSDLSAFVFALNLEIEINQGFSISALAGYVLTDYDALTFRQLPFSVELDAGNLGGYIVGAEVNKSLLYFDEFAFGLSGQFLYHMGIEKTWDVPDLNVSGTVTGKPTWMRASAGAYIKFLGLESFSPYLAVCYNNLWGQYEMKQAIQNLTGTEEKELRSKSLVDITLGSILSLSDGFFLKGEAHLLPYSDGLDLGFVAIAAFAF